ncbi:hypothetical protein NA57DRAFT_53913 [Rhizodiscina lignyota]|uniref:Uncharacterized protein n=1 Tax=Rhizodiscina lignyota TaxID=1504668 RepID=A0A9P4IL62_9PEZI|nr:hypothetical protein NA57DRAFT_53913 [Rhizodiscina lignyota]
MFRYARVLLLSIICVIVILSVLPTQDFQIRSEQFISRTDGPQADTANFSTNWPDSAFGVFVCLKTDDRAWIDEELSFIPQKNRVFYFADDVTAQHHPPLNQGREAMSYLSFIVEHYDDLPDIMVFLHCHCDSPHNNRRFSDRTSPMLSSLNFSHVTKRGFVNLLCDRDGTPGCNPAKVYELHRLSSPSFRNIDMSTHHRLFTQSLADTLRTITADLPKEILVPRGAQFAVTRETVKAVPLQHFELLLARLMHLGPDPGESFRAGQIMENLWHVIFLGADHGVLCAPEDECYCHLYSMCAD